MKIYIAGSGAMGCRFGAQLKESGNDVTLLDNWEDHIREIQKNGLKITGDNERTVQIPIMKPTEATEEADLIILFTKAVQLPQMLEDIQGLINENTKVLCLLNGLGHEDIIKKYVPMANIMMGVTIWTAGLLGPGHAHLMGTGTVNLQSMDDSGETFGRQVADVLTEAGLGAEYDNDIIPSIWRKACVNGTMNSTCALLDCTIGEFFASEHVLTIVENIIKEFVDVAHLENVDIDYDEMLTYVKNTAEKAAHHYPSMHQDLIQNKRKTEIDVINGAVVSKAKKHDVKVPYCEQIVDLIHAKESVIQAK